MTKNKKALKHSKYKNTGLLFELLIRQIAADAFKDDVQPSKAARLVRKYFKEGTQLQRERLIFETLNNPSISSKFRTRDYANSLIEEVLNESTKINQRNLRREKYGLVKEINEAFGEEFFKTNVPNYKPLASIYKLLIALVDDKVEPRLGEITKIKETIIEHILNGRVIGFASITPINAHSKHNKIESNLIWKFLVEKFNKKYGNLSNEQKEVLQKYVESPTDSQKMRDMLSSYILLAESRITKNLHKIDDDVVKVKTGLALKKLDIVKVKINEKRISDGVVTETLLFLQFADELERL